MFGVVNILTSGLDLADEIFYLILGDIGLEDEDVLCCKQYERQLFGILFLKSVEKDSLCIIMVAWMECEVAMEFWRG